MQVSYQTLAQEYDKLQEKYKSLAADHYDLRFEHKKLEDMKGHFEMYENTIRAIAREFNSRRKPDESELGLGGVYLAVVDALCELDDLKKLPKKS